MNSTTDSAKFNCEQCEMQFTRKDNLKKHVQLAHEGKPDYICPVCQKGFVHKRDFTVHCENVHKGGRKGRISKNKEFYNGRKFEYATLFCHQCDYSCRHSQQLTIHISTKHEGERHNCSQCDKRYTHIQDLNKHIKADHEGRRFKCDLCDFEARTKSEVKGHRVRNHTSQEERVKYPCDFCVHIYLNKTGLRDHINAIHSNEEAIQKCDKCPFNTKWLSSMRKHLQAFSERVWRVKQRLEIELEPHVFVDCTASGQENGQHVRHG